VTSAALASFPEDGEAWGVAAAAWTCTGIPRQGKGGGRRQLATRRGKNAAARVTNGHVMGMRRLQMRETQIPAHGTGEGTLFSSGAARKFPAGPTKRPSPVR
jgi:hypothetical protein